MLLWLSAGRAGGQVLTLTPSLAVSEGYDDNLFQTHRDREADFVTLLTPALALRYAPSPTTSLDLDYRTRFAFFARHTEQNQVSQRAALRLATPLLALLRVNLSDTFELTEEPLERELTIEEVTGLRPVSTQRRRRTLRNRADLALDVRLLPRIALNPFFESLIVDVDVPDEVDEVRYRLGGDLGYITHVARDSRLSVVYDVTLHFFTTNPGGAARSDFAVHTLAARFRHALSPTLTSDVSVGYARTTSDDAALDGENSLVANVRLVKTLRDGQLALGYQRRLTSGGGEGEAVVADVLTLSVSAPLTPLITARLGVNVSWFDFDTATLGSGGDRFFLALRPGVTYQMLRFFSLAVDYSFEATDFTEEALDLDFANRQDHRLVVTSRLALRNWLFLEVSYAYTQRRFNEVTAFRGAEAFTRHQVTVSLTTAPTLRF